MNLYFYTFIDYNYYYWKIVDQKRFMIFEVVNLLHRQMEKPFRPLKIKTLTCDNLSNIL